jgi:galactokinase
LPSIIRIIKVKEGEMDRACSTYGEKKSASRILVGKLEGNRLLEKPRHRWEDITRSSGKN